MSLITNATRTESLSLCLLAVKGKRLEVLRKLDRHQFLTRAELNKETGIRISTLCSTLKRLEGEGWVRVAFDTYDTETRRSVACYTTSVDADARIRNASGAVERHWLDADRLHSPPSVALP